MKRLFRIQAVLAAALLAAGAAHVARAEDGGGRQGGQNNEVRFRATLHGPAIHGIRPEGNADFRFDTPSRLRLKVEVESVNLPAGTVLMVALQHAGMTTNAGSIILSSGGDAELELDSQEGRPAPVVHRGDVVTVSSDGNVIAAGVFLASN